MNQPKLAKLLETTHENLGLNRTLNIGQIEIEKGSNSITAKRRRHYYSKQKN